MQIVWGFNLPRMKWYTFYMNNIIDIAIIVFFIISLLYNAYQFYIVMGTKLGKPLLLFKQAETMKHEDMVIRRMYASEFWITLGVFFLYLILRQ